MTAIMVTLALAAGAVCVRAADPPADGRPAIILDVDLAEDVDDAGAIAVLHALADRGECDILALLVSSKNEWVVPCAEAINAWYGRPDLPVGYQREHRHGYRNPTPIRRALRRRSTSKRLRGLSRTARSRAATRPMPPS
ncbi:MAG: hypothetical protein FJX72_06225 [Armatimonadetes bacterium]|nr:hypothetical protein [Armatimonadota bacterium]